MPLRLLSVGGEMISLQIDNLICHCEARIGVSLNQSVSSRAKDFKYLLINPTDCFVPRNDNAPQAKFTHEK
jgi:hypothetical protein